MVIGLTHTPPKLQGCCGGCGVQDLLGELWDGIEGAAIYLAGSMLLAECCITPTVVPADREISAPKCAAPHIPPPLATWG